MYPSKRSRTRRSPQNRRRSTCAPTSTGCAPKPRPSLSGEWLGRAAASFADGWREWHRDAGEVIAALDELAEALRCAARAYENADTSGRTTLHLAAT